jgi:CIC family chloride channel protein
LAAAVGAIFHSAVGGGIFAVEVIEKAEMRYRDLFPAILSSAIAVFICKALGWFPFYPINAVDQFMDLGIAGWLLVTMVLAGFLGKVFNNLYVFVARVIRRENIQRIVLKVLVGTLIASWLGFFINPDLMGTSNELIQALFDNNKEQIYGNLSSTIPFFWVLLLLILVKASANCITVGSGMSAGFTGPAVILGMLLGALMANVVGVSHASANYYAFMAAGFSGMLASSMNVPIAAAVITIESFGLQYGIPAGFAAIIGFQTNRAHTIYDFAISTEFSGDQEN